MMSSLQIYVLGSFQVLQRGRSLTTFRTDKIRALLAYLVVESDRPHRRESLATIFWSEMDTGKALTNLRLSLHRLRYALGNAPLFLHIDRHTVQFDRSKSWVDVLAFEQALVAAAACLHPAGQLCPDCVRHLETAVATYRGDFLAGFFLPDSTAFDDWEATCRERFHQEALQALDWLADYHQGNNRLIQAIPYIRRQLELEPWREPAHRRLMQLLAETGQHATALNQYERCRRMLRDELDIAPHAETTHLYEQIQAETRKDLSSRENRRHHIPFSPAQQITSFLPATATPFVGRQAELKRLDQLFCDPTVQLVTIIGLGGAGKTRLALNWSATQAVRHPERFPHGVYYISLIEVDSAERLVPEIAQALSFSIELDSAALVLTRRLLDYLQDRQLLLVLDNVEQLLDGDGGQKTIAFLGNLLGLAPRLKLLVTSRVRLQLHSEQVLSLGGLQCPENGDKDLADIPAVQLFTQNACRIQPDFALSPQDVPYLIDICRLLDGNPLALELAAAWVEWLSLPDIEAEIKCNFDFLATELQDWPERHRSVRSVLDTSWTRLSRPEQTFFVRLCLFRDSFTRAAAQAVAGEGQTPTTVLRLLTSLTNKSLLHYERLIDRYAIHELVRQYGSEKLARSPAMVDVQDRCVAYFCHWLNQQETYLKGEHQKEALCLIEADLANIRNAWKWAIQIGHPAFLAEAAFSLGLALLRTGRFAEGAALFDEAVEEFGTRALDEEESGALARLWYWRAVFEPSLSRRQQGLERSLALLERNAASEEAVRADKAAVLTGLSILARGQGRHEVADKSLTQSLALFRLSGDRWGEANVLYELGVRTWRKGDYTLSGQWFGHCLQLRRRLGDLAGAAMALEGSAGPALFSGDARRSLAILRQSYAVYQQLEDQVGMARLKIKQAQISWYLNLDGLELFKEGLDSLHQLGALRNVALWTAVHAMLLADVNIDEAVSEAEQGLQWCEELDDQRGAAIARGVLSRAALVKGRYSEALELAEAYLQAVQALSLAVEYSDALVWRAWASLALGDVRRAEQDVSEALQIPSYWRAACMDLVTVLLAYRSPENYAWAWQILGYGESICARLRGPISQQILSRFLPHVMQEMPAEAVQKLKEEGRHIDADALFRQITATFNI